MRSENIESKNAMKHFPTENVSKLIKLCLICEISLEWRFYLRSFEKVSSSIFRQRSKLRLAD